jgi:dipeptidyl aminopeptidase/acylaminoacyl peptidase
LEDRVELLFRPPLADMMALSPEGQRVAYTTSRGSDLAIVIMNVDHPGPKKTVKVNPERAEDAPETPEDPPAVQLRFLRWATPTRLIYAPVARIVPLPPVVAADGRVLPNPDGPAIVSPILATDADGKQRGALVDARDFQETPADARKTLADLLRTTKELQATRNEPVRWRMPHLDILGFFPSDREQLIIQTHGGYSMPRQHLVDVRTGSVREFGGDWPSPPGEPQVFDWSRLKVVGERKDAVHPATVWRDDDLGRTQRELENKFPRRIVEILDWSETRARVLFRVTGGSDPGRIFVWQRPENLALEILRRAPWLTAAKLNDTRFFECAAPDGARLSGYLTWPKAPRPAPPPLLVILPTGFPGRAQPAFDPEAQVFADLGFVVARLNHRSVAGVRTEDLASLRSAVDRVSVDDTRAAIEWIAARMPDRPFDRRRIATLGRGFGGYLAVRALQLQPAMFRCGIAIDAPMDLRPWLRPPQTERGPAAPPAGRDIPVALIDHADANWKGLSVLDQAETLTNPVLLVVEPSRNPAIDVSTQTLQARLKRDGRVAEHVELDPEFAAAQPAARATMYRKIEEFFNQHLHPHAVKIGPLKEVE